MTLETTVDLEKQFLEIKISGRFDFSVHQDFRRATQQASSGINKIVVDMSQTDYVDSSALGMLLVLRDKVGENKNAISLKNANPDVRKILDIANFDKLFTLI
jgi:anti-anti-sigma factor